MNFCIKRSPNFSDRGQAKPIAVVIHYDGSPHGLAAVDWMRNPISKVSANIHIDRDGLITELVQPGCTAWHAGVSTFIIDGASYINVNYITIGIELANIGKLEKRGEDFIYKLGNNECEWKGEAPQYGVLDYPNKMQVTGWWEPFARPLLDSLHEYIAWLQNNSYADASTQLFGHDEIALPMGRKMDPGPLFPWDEFHRDSTRKMISTTP